MEKGKVSLMEFETNPNIGLYMFVNDKFCLLGVHIDEKKKKEIENILKVPVHIISVLGTELCGVFLAGNNDYLFTPEMSKTETEELEKITKKYNVELITLKDKLNTIGNNMCVGDKIIILNSEYPVAFVNSLKKKNRIRNS